MIVEINPDNPEPRKIRRAVDTLESGGVIAYPTDTVYGLGCDLSNKKGVEKLYQLKQMPRTQQLAFVCSDISQVAEYAVLGNQDFRTLRRYLPGPYCFILNATREVPRVVQSKRRQVGVRIPAHQVAIDIVKELGRPIISTTAAAHGETPHVDPRELDDEFSGLDMVLDGGAGGLEPTTVVDLTGDDPVVIREGAGDATPFL